MDKYLMSSPTQLSQPFEVGSDSTYHMAMDVPEYDSNQTSNDKQYQQDDSGPVSANSTSGSKNVFLHSDFENMSLMGFSGGADDTTMNGADFGGHDSTYLLDEEAYQNLNLNLQASARFNHHSKNVSLDDGMYSSQLLSSQYGSHRTPSHQSNLSTSSMISVSQDPPMYSGGSATNDLHNSFSSNTIYSMESMPQLSSSVSNQSLSDSPSSNLNKQHQIHNQAQTHLHQPVTATPRRIGRNKSLSVSSVTNVNLYHTPMRGGPAGTVALSPINLANPPASKVTKTPHSSKAKGHSRSRSRISFDASNTPLPWATASKSSSFQNMSGMNLNPFYTPSTFVSPRVDQISGELDDIGTPLPTPNSSMSSNQNPNRVVPASGNAFQSPSNQWNSGGSGSFGTPLPPTLKRTDTLESIKIEDQDDDAFKQLKKAKSYSSFPNALPYSKSSSKLKKAASQYIHNNVKDEKNSDYVSAADLSLKLATKLSSQSTIPDNNLDTIKSASEEIMSSNSTPGVFYTSTSPINNYGKLHDDSDVAGSTSYSVPTTSSEYEQSTESLGSGVSLRAKAGGIDLLSAQFVSDNTPKKFNRTFSTKALNSSTSTLVVPAGSGSTASFTKSYPASIDLASIATSPMDASLSAPPTFTQSLQGQSSRQRPSTSLNSPASNSGSGSTPNSQFVSNNQGLLPPMATFSTSQQQEYYKEQLQTMQELQEVQHSQQQQKTLPHSHSVDLSQLATSLGTGNSSSDATTVPISIPLAKIDIPIVKNNRGDKSDRLNPKKKHGCPICDARFQRPEHVKRHMKSHSSEKPFQCDEATCGKRFNRKDNLKAHLKKIHGRQL